MSTSIKVDQVSMMFNMSSEKVDNIKEYFIRVLKHKIAVEPFWALQDVSFELKRGDSLGVIGLNGSGKSTLLKLVSGILKPTKGTVETYGSIAPLIELGAGFDPELSALNFCKAFCNCQSQSASFRVTGSIPSDKSLGQFLSRYG